MERNYIDGMAAERALQMDEEQLFDGSAMVSLETQDDLIEHDISVYVQEHFADFIRLLRYLSPEDQELLLSYYVLSKSQTCIGLIQQTTQTVCSAWLRRALQRFGSILLLGVPTQQVMSEILSAAGMEKVQLRKFGQRNRAAREFSLSILIDAYAKTRSFQQVADHYQLHRPGIRRAMVQASKKLVQSSDNREVALGAYVRGLIDRDGRVQCRRRKQKNLRLTDPAALGKFRVAVTDPAFEHVFTARASL